MSDITPGWSLVYSGIEGSVAALGGLNIWKVHWRDLQVPPIIVAHPEYPAQRHSMWVCELAGAHGPIKFAAGEFSNGIWGVYLPTTREGGAVA